MRGKCSTGVTVCCLGVSLTVDRGANTICRKPRQHPGNKRKVRDEEEDEEEEEDKDKSVKEVEEEDD